MKENDADDCDPTSMMVVCFECGAYNDIKQKERHLKYRCGNCKSEIRNPLFSSDEENSRVCRECRRVLENEPAILIDGNCYCFLHAKSLYPKIIKEQRKQEKEINLKYEVLRSRYQEAKSSEELALRLWHFKRSEHTRNNGFSKWKWAWCLMFVILIILMNPGFGLLVLIPCLMAVPFIDEWFQEQKGIQFDAEFPPPTINEEIRPPDYKNLPRPKISMHPGNHVPASMNIGYCREKILQRDDFKCQNCRHTFQPELLEVHHVNPLAKGGCDSPRNLITLCLKCHLVEDWFGHVHKMKASSGLKKFGGKRGHMR